MIRTKKADHWLTVGAQLGEGPFWDPRTDRLGFVDIERGRFFSTDGRTLDLIITVDTSLGAVLPSSHDGEFLLVAGAGFGRLTAERRLESSLPVLADNEDLRFNDAKSDPRGRCLAGTLSTSGRPGCSALFALDPGPHVRQLRGSMGLANGLGWSPDGRMLYHADTFAGTIEQFPYDPDTGHVTDRGTVLVHAPTPDGLAVDTDGCLWVAMWGGAELRRYTPRGRLDQTLQLPVPHVTSCAFFGDLLIITTAGTATTAGGDRIAFSGDLFAADVGISAPSATLWNDVLTGTPPA